MGTRHLQRLQAEQLVPDDEKESDDDDDGPDELVGAAPFNAFAMLDGDDVRTNPACNACALLSSIIPMGGVLTHSPRTELLLMLRKPGATTTATIKALKSKGTTMQTLRVRREVHLAHPRARPRSRRQPRAARSRRRRLHKITALT